MTWHGLIFDKKNKKNEGLREYMTTSFIEPGEIPRN